jgi:5'-nucleotidase
VKGRNPHLYLPAFNASLFLSAHAEDVPRVVAAGLPAGEVFPTRFVDDEAETELRIAFDFDGIIADDSAEAVFKTGGLASFHASERERALEPMTGRAPAALLRRGGGRAGQGAHAPIA